MSKPNRTVIITGASRGIGAATAIVAGEHGWNVVINYRNNKSQAEQVRDHIIKQGGTAAIFQGDVAEQSDVIALFEFTDNKFGKLHGLINNAGIVAARSRLEDMDEARIDRLLATNVKGSFLCAREAVKRMSTKHSGEGGAIVNVSSAAARLGSAGEYIDYAASKGAIDSMTIGLANEVAEEGIRVNAVRPGFIDTEIHALAGQPDRLQRVKKNIPMRRAGHAEEVAQAIFWLLSDQSSYCTGSFIDCSGGR